MSAALQTAPHQAAALAAASRPSPTSRQFPATSQHSPTKETYHEHRHLTEPPSSRRHQASASPPADIAATIAARSAVVNASFPQHSPQSDRFNMPPVAPPRTSSNQQNGSSRRANYTTDKPSNSPRQHQQLDPARSEARGGPAETQSRRPGSSRAQAQTHAQEGRDGWAPETALPIRSNAVESSSRHPQEASENLMRAMKAAEEPHSRDERSHQQSAPPAAAAAAAAAAIQSRHHEAAPAPAVNVTPNTDEKRGQRSRQDHSRSHHKTSKFGDFILGNTIGEGEFGKVKLGWKQDSSVQVAIKLIKRETVGGNPSRLAKIRREVSILRGLNHPNIVRLFEMVETDRYIGIVLEYASGGELFDYILNHRYLKDNSARRLFSQLISGVGYLHKKGIVHRDLKLENLLLDRNRNIIITDFGFANTFDPNEELTEEEELHLQDKDQVKRMGLDKVKHNGMRRGDLMQTSCGSPCYAAPELVVSDSLYTGRKVDVWSCGVILYAMLAGYLPFDDDPANPEGDNINLLYKYIVSTPLTFPEYVTPHARDLLRRILVPNPRKRADLFEVARHSWLSEYAHVVEFITSSTTLPGDIQNASSPRNEFTETPMVTRSASVRESAKQKSPQSTAVGGLAKTHGKIDTPPESSHRTPKDAKRRTVQVEYVAPTTQTQRGEDPAISTSRSHGHHSGADRDHREDIRGQTGDKPLPMDPPAARDAYSRTAQGRSGPPVSHNPTRPTRDGRAYAENTYGTNSQPSTRPQTGGSMQSVGSTGLQSRVVNYGQPAPPTVADTNAQGRIQQPSSGDEEYMGRASVSVPPKFARVSGFHEARLGGEVRGHKRSSTIGDISSKLLGRSGSVFGRKNKQRSDVVDEKAAAKKYPPVSLANTAGPGEVPGRQSIDSHMSSSRRSFSLGLGKKRSGSMTDSHASVEKKDKRRFSLLPASFSLKSIGLGKEQHHDAPASDVDSQQDVHIQDSRKEHLRSFTAPGDARGAPPFFDNVTDPSHRQDTANSSPAHHHRYQSVQLDNRLPNAVPPYLTQQSASHFNSGSESSMDMRRPPTEPSYRQSYADSDGYEARRVGTSGSGRGVLQKNHKRFTDAYDQGGELRGHEGSTGAAKRVMDFFRRRGKARAGDDR